MKMFYALVESEGKTYVVGQCKSRLDAEHQSVDYIKTHSLDNAKISGIYPFKK